ncbi:hypothetical protein D5086_024589 [Populus alba]|uniref:Uncharacterized protein n=1 Tax=Populus alba TaxID=43335 RepID=A0ACC4B6I8_POPAL
MLFYRGGSTSTDALYGLYFRYLKSPGTTVHFVAPRCNINSVSIPSPAAIFAKICKQSLFLQKPLVMLSELGKQFFSLCLLITTHSIANSICCF